MLLNLSKSEYDQLIEILAEQEHEQWMSWTRNVVLDNGASDETVCRWRQNWIPYSELADEVKEKDRIWARKVLDIILAQKPQ